MRKFANLWKSTVRAELFVWTEILLVTTSLNKNDIVLMSNWRQIVKASTMQAKRHQSPKHRDVELIMKKFYWKILDLTNPINIRATLQWCPAPVHSQLNVKMYTIPNPILHWTTGVTIRAQKNEHNNVYGKSEHTIDSFDYATQPSFRLEIFKPNKS